MGDVFAGIVLIRYCILSTAVLTAVLTAPQQKDSHCQSKMRQSSDILEQTVTH
jgi:hypothetical protein